MNYKTGKTLSRTITLAKRLRTRLLFAGEVVGAKIRIFNDDEREIVADYGLTTRNSSISQDRGTKGLLIYWGSTLTVSFVFHSVCW